MEKHNLSFDILTTQLFLKASLNLIKKYGSVAFSYVLKNANKTFFKNFKFECVLE